MTIIIGIPGTTYDPPIILLHDIKIYFIYLLKWQSFLNASSDSILDSG